MKYITAILLLIFFNIARTQSPDSLKRLLTTSVNEQKAEFLLALDKMYWYKNWDSAFVYANEALQFSRKINNVKTMAEAYRHIGVINMYSARSENAVPYFDSSLKLFDHLKD